MTLIETTLDTTRVPELPVKTIGNYELTRRIGEGATGVVYQAHNPALQRRAAIKILRRSFVDNNAVVNRFLNEARVSAAMRHPNLVEVFDCGTLPDGAPFIVMELLEGETLRARLGRGPISIASAVDLLRQAAAGLGAAHARGIVHRDLKPENLFLVMDPARQKFRVRVFDFGVAQLRDWFEGAVDRSHPEPLLGTPLYMSPEQCLGQPSLDGRSDVYSLGVIGYELLCGRLPFQSAMAGAVMDMHLHTRPIAPRTLRADLSPRLEMVLLKMLAKDPADRFASCEEVIQALDEAGRYQAAIPTAPPSRAPASRRGRSRLGRWMRLVLLLEAIAGALLIYRGVSGHRAGAPQVKMATLNLESEPPGASVSVAGKPLGRTPLQWQFADTGQPVDVMFTLDGHAPEIVHLVPVEGLKLRARLNPRPR